MSGFADGPVQQSADLSQHQSTFAEGAATTPAAKQLREGTVRDDGRGQINSSAERIVSVVMVLHELHVWLLKQGHAIDHVQVRPPQLGEIVANLNEVVPRPTVAKRVNESAPWPEVSRIFDLGDQKPGYPCGSVSNHA